MWPEKCARLDSNQRPPPIDVDGAASTKARVKEVLDLGADGITIPHVTSLDEAKLAISFFRAANANVWSPSNPGGHVIAMLMLEDAAAVAQAKEVADLKGYSILACGIGSLAQALGGDRAGAEAGTQKVLVEAKRAKLADMLTANPQDVEQRVKEGFLRVPAHGSGSQCACACNDQSCRGASRTWPKHGIDGYYSREGHQPNDGKT
jgi:2-keto-3-deoxy-L-rhamnonate aldolase RhmA